MSCSRYLGEETMEEGFFIEASDLEVFSLLTESNSQMLACSLGQGA